MKFCILSDGIITNIIVCDSDEIAAQFGAVPSYEGARIGDTYDPPLEPEPEPPPEYVTYSELAAAIREGVNAV